MSTTQREALTEIHEWLATRNPIDHREHESIAIFRRELARLNDPFNEDADRVHLTSSAVVVGRRGIVLHLHKRAQIWIQPGGHIDASEPPADGAVRETLEETGLGAIHAYGAPLLVHVDAHEAPKGHLHLDLRYLLAAPDVDPSPPVGESQHVEWRSFAMVAADAEPGIAGIASLLASPSRWTLRRAVRSDALAIASVYWRAHHEALPNVPLAHPFDDVVRFVRETLIDTQQTFVVEIVPGAVAAFASLAPEQSGLLSHLYVDTPFQSAGLGSRLLDHLRADEFDQLWLWTFQANTKARSYYERQGFRAVEFTDGADNEEQAPDVRYVWTR